MLVFVSTALAAPSTPVLYAQGDPDEILAALRKHREVSERDFVAVSIGEISAIAPKVTGGQERFCESAPVDLAVVLAHLKKAEGDLLYLDFAGALKALNQAHKALPCLSSAADGALLTRIHYLMGYAHFTLGQRDEAEQAFARLFQIRVEVPWDQTFPPDPIDLFEATRETYSHITPVPFELVPPPPDSTVLIDGQQLAPSNTVVPGTHLVQVITAGETHTVELTVDGGNPLTLVWPSLFPNTGIDWMKASGGQTQVSALLNATVGGDAAIVYSPTDTWRRQSRSADFVSLSKSLQVGGGRSGWVVLGGGVIAAGGVSLALVSSSIATQAVDTAEQAQGIEAYDRAEEEYFTARTQRRTGLVLTMGGVAVTGLGLVAPLTHGSLSIGPGTIGVTWSF